MGSVSLKTPKEVVLMIVDLWWDDDSHNVYCSSVIWPIKELWGVKSDPQ